MSWKNERRAILESVHDAREGRIERRHAPFAEHMCRIPMADWQVLLKTWPGLASPNTAERDAALTAFHASPASEPYRVRRRVMGQRPRGVIVRPAPYRPGDGR